VIVGDDADGIVEVERVAGAGLVVEGGARGRRDRSERQRRARRPAPAARPVGTRAGTPALTTRGFGPDEMATVADCIAELADPSNGDVRRAVGDTVAELCERFSLYG